MAKKITDKKEPDDIVARAQKFFQKVVEYESAQRAEELDDLLFVGKLEQWPANIKQIREQDPQGARPCLVVDKVNQYTNQITNQMRQNRPSIKARPVDDNADIEVADIYQGIIRHIEDSSHADIAYDWAGEGAVKTGVGYFRIRTQYVDDTFQQEIKIDRIRNRFSVYFDPNSKEPDGCDCMECLITERIPKKDFEDEYPDADMSTWGNSVGDGDWYDGDMVRVAEYYWIEKKKERLFLLADGTSVFESDYLKRTETNPALLLNAPIKERQGERKIVHWAKVSPSEVLEQTIIPGYYIPVIPCIGIETDIDGKRYLRGAVRGVKDAQRMYNYNRSMIVESLALSSKAPWVGAVGQFKSKGERWAASNRVNFAFLEYDPVTTNGQLAPPPQRQGFDGVPVGLLQDIQTSEHDIQAALGMYQASIGQDSNAKSGIALDRQQRQGDMATFQFPDNQAKSIRHAGCVIMGMIPFVYDTAQVVRIIGEDGTADQVKIDPEQQEPVRKDFDEQGNIQKIYNLGVGKYDVTITVGPSYATKRMEGADFINQVVQTSPNLMPVVGDLLFKAMDLPYAQEISERLKKLAPPEIQENNEEDAQVQAVKNQAQQIIGQLSQQLQAAHQAMAEAEQEAQQMQSKINDNASQSAYDMKKLEIDAYNAQTNRIKVEIDAAQQAVQNATSPEDIELLMESVAHLVTLIQPPQE